MERARVLLLVLLAMMLIPGCKKEPPPADVDDQSPPGQPGAKAPEQPGVAAKAVAGWAVEKIATIETGLIAPESILPDPATGQVFVSNIETETEGYWEKDGKGFISVIGSDGVVKTLRWLDSTENNSIHAPKGMCVLNGKLYFADITSLKRCDAQTGQNPEKLTESLGERLNDVATDGTVVWVSDVQLGKIFRVEPEGDSKEVKAPEGVNGVTCWQGKVFAVSWGLHDVYEIDAMGLKDPVAFGLADQFTALDGIEVLDDGTFIVSDFEGGKVCAISPDRKTVTTLVELETPADIGIDRKAGILYVPQLKANKAVLYKLAKKSP